eukprot:5930513-Amphidinium_carterae.1
MRRPVGGTSSPRQGEATTAPPSRGGFQLYQIPCIGQPGITLLKWISVTCACEYKRFLEQAIN